MHSKIVIFLLIFTTSFAKGQTDTVSIFKNFRDTTGHKKTVMIQQDPLIRLLIERDITINQKQNGIKNGYRIQIFSSFGNDARERSKKLRTDFLTLFPDFDPTQVYSTYEPPLIKIRVGDYRNRSEALQDYRNIVKEFPDCYIVKTSIDYPHLNKK